MWIDWIHLVESLMHVVLSEDCDSFVCKLNGSGVFIVKSVYADMMSGHTPFLCKYMENKGTAKDYDLYVVLLKKVILIKDNLAKRRWSDLRNQSTIYFFIVS